MFNLEKEGEYITAFIKNQTWFPYKTGKLKYEATQGVLIDQKTYKIHFDGTIAPYLESLEEGSKPHDIPHAFGKPLPFGIGGKFDGRFHPGSTKHKGFIKEKSVGAIVNYISSIYNGVVEVR